VVVLLLLAARRDGALLRPSLGLGVVWSRVHKREGPMVALLPS
jgi:hypothetical protein